MKSLRKHYAIILFCLAIGAAFGSCFDLQISKKIFSRTDSIALFSGAFGLIPGFAVLCFFAGTLITSAFKIKQNLFLTIFLIGSCVFFILLGTYCPQEDIFGVNGYNLPDKTLLGYAIPFPIMLISAAAGYLVSSKNQPALGSIKKADSKNRGYDTWLFTIVLLFFLSAALLFGLFCIKKIMHRPRFRLVVFEGYAPFHAWWQRFEDYKNVLNDNTIITKEEFKSFPSGHAAMTSLLMILGMYLPIVNAGWKKAQVPVIYIGFAITIFIAYTRIRLGAHYLSDVSIGAFIMITGAALFNETAIRLQNRFPDFFDFGPELS